MTSNRGYVFDYGNAPYYSDVRDLGVADVIDIAATSPALAPEQLHATTDTDVMMRTTQTCFDTSAVVTRHRLTRDSR
jgi:hypothetical protein